MDFKNFFATQQKSYKWLLTVAIVFFIVFFIFSLAILTFNIFYKEKVFPRSFLGQTLISGLNKNQVEKIIDEKINKINEDGFSFLYNSDKSIIKPIITSDSSDFAYELISFDREQTKNALFKPGRTGNVWLDLIDRFNLLFNPQKNYFQYQFNGEAIKGILSSDFAKYDKPAQNATLVYDASKGFSVTEERFGQILDFDAGIKTMKENINNGNTGIIYLSYIKSEPTIFKSNNNNAIIEAEELIKVAPIKITYKKNAWLINKDILANWLDLNYNTGNSKAMVVPSTEKIAAYLEKNISPKINIEPRNSKFIIENGKVKEFQVSQAGKKLNATSSSEKIIEQILNPSKKEVELIADEIKSIFNEDELNNISIKEIIGTGESNFSGSPANRRHNIKVGATAVNGTLIKPDEEFSLLHTLGKVDGKTGYLQELVIKENKTIPEYGGGLCQIGTTMFRGAVASGLPITMRRNHSYRVQYYEPAGTDATIYDPAPDMRFINDTGNYILIQSRIEGNKVYFDFWGTSDGRVIEKTKPVIYNIVKPASGKVVESADLKPGEKKCTERAHNGADAYFDYKVTYTSGEIKKVRFSSHYVPWQEVCLIGPGGATASSTPTNAGSSGGSTLITNNNTNISSTTKPTP